jgi:2-(1,2-epoxy-1,2-dihydrophenyl)acetyl-CoA isomerase
MTYEQILAERRGNVLLLTLNRPDKLNAWTPRMHEELGAAIAEANEDDEIGAIVLTGAGRAFCAGADIGNWNRDLKEGEAPQANPARTSGDSWVHVLRKAKPVVVAVNGVAVGLGLSQILPADIRIASESARFGLFFVRAGVVPELASTYFLSQIVGLGAAQELTLTARMFDAQEALRLGLVSRVVPDEQLLDAALELAGTIAALPGPQLRLTKQLFTRNAADTDIDAVIAREGEALAQAYKTPEFREAVTSFMEKRPPDFRSARAKTHAV